jgi:hypothetical protein
MIAEAVPEAADIALLGNAVPRIAPPRPARSEHVALISQATELGIELMPWQSVVTRYTEAGAPDGSPLFPEVAVVVARQNGKTRLLVPLIVSRLRRGLRIMHAAQNRELPREVHAEVCDVMMDRYRSEVRGKPRFANGQERIRTTNGGDYRVVAATRGGARGPSNDTVILDEAREEGDWAFISAAKPTLTASRYPQFIYLSNAGDSTSVVLNALRARKDDDPSLAYLEWSAAATRKPDDITGWLESNPAIGHLPHVLATLEREFRTNQLAGTMPIFETEHLCRWVTSTHSPLVEEAVWLDAKADLGIPRRPMMAVSMDPSGLRASAVIAWRRSDPDDIGVRVVAEVYGTPGKPIDVDVFGTELRDFARGLNVRTVGFAPWTDADLARYFPTAKPLDGRTWAVASEAFARMVEGGRVHWDGGTEVGDDLAWTVRKAHEGGAWHAVKAKDDRPITAALAAVRAVWLASDPKPSGSLRVQ